MAVKGAATKTTTPVKSVPGRLWRMARAVLYMVRRGVMPSGRKLTMDVRRVRLAGKALSGFVSFHSHAAARSSSVAARRREARDDDQANSYDAVDIARVFEMINDSGHVFGDDNEDALALATPSPALPTFFKCGAAAGQLRVTETPFVASEHQQVDSMADEFIKRFYEQLRAQQSLAATPDYYGYAAGSYNGHVARVSVAV